MILIAVKKVSTDARQCVKKNSEKKEIETLCCFSTSTTQEMQTCGAMIPKSESFCDY